MSTEQPTSTGHTNLQRAITAEVAAGGRIEQQTEDTAIIRHEMHINHTLHLILTLVTLSLWAWVWIALAIMAAVKNKTIMLTVGEDGIVQRSIVR